MNKIHVPFIVIWLLAVSILATFSFFVFNHAIAGFWLIIPLLIIGLVAFDTFQNKSAIRKNYPLVGRLRYLLESFRPELRQYFFENELDGRPFNRRQRSIVYQRAKNEKQTVSFGMQDDPNRIGYEWAAHSVYPKKADFESFRVLIGNHQCKQPYNASILNIGAMSFGALSKTAVTALNKGKAKGGFAHNTGEGGISEYHLNGADVIFQFGTGYFGCRNDDGSFSERFLQKRLHYPKLK